MMRSRFASNIAEIVKRLSDAGSESEDLDELVRDTASEVVSAVNNSGLIEQVRWLVSNGVAEVDIINSAVERQTQIECALCGEDKPEDTAHIHQDEWICDDCWDERLRTTE